MIEGEWGEEERDGGMPFIKGHEFNIKMICEEEGFRIFMNNNELTFYKHRVPAKSIHKLEVKGKVKLFKITYYSTEVSLIK